MPITIPTERRLPRRVDGKAQLSPPGDLDRELVEFYMAEHRISERIATGFLAFGLEPPTREQIEARGFTMFQSKVLDATAPTDQLGEG